jgi:branched-chain amino acid transport system permease protein
VSSAKGKGARIVALHLAVIAALFAVQFLLPAYHHGNLARIMVFASFAVGYNLLLGYTGLLSLGHAMFFAAGMYGAGLPLYYFDVGVLQAFGLGLLASFGLALSFGLLALRASGIAFLIVTLMFAQAFFLATLYFNEITLGDQGFVLSEQARTLTLGGVVMSFADPTVKYNAALLLFSCCMLGCLALVRSPIGRVWVAIRENEPRTRMLGYDTYRYKLLALVLSGVICGAAGAGYALLFAYVGSTFASIQYSIFALLWTLLGGVGTVLGPLVGAGLMFYLVDIAGDFTSSYLLVVGVVLLLLILWYPKGLLGSLRARWLPWLP